MIFNQMFLVFFILLSTRKCFVLFELIFLWRLTSLVSKSVFITKFAPANLATKVLAFKLLNPKAVVYLS